MNTRQFATFVGCAIFTAGSLLAQQAGAPPASFSGSGVTITEPGIYTLAQLYKAADTVAIIEITAGDTESYSSAVYKGRVTTAFKGASEGQTVFFGPFTRQELGSQYVVFLKKQKEPLAPNKGATAFGIIPYAVDFDQGFTEMRTDYECVFHPTKPGDVGCDYAVRVCTDFIKLPKGIPISTYEDNDTSGCRYVRKPTFLSLLDGLKSAERPSVSSGVKPLPAPTPRAPSGP
jgi:hypothetical protein